MQDCLRRLAAEALGTALLVMIVVGSGLRAQRVAPDDGAIALAVASVAGAAGLAALLVAFGGISGGHLNPAVSLSAMVRGAVSPGRALRYAAVQLAGAVLGVLAVHLMFGERLVAASLTPRTGAAQWASEAFATFGLVGVGMATARVRPALVPAAVSAWLGAGCWFTVSSSYANPALTLACALTAAPCGMRLADAPGFMLAQCAGALAGTLVFHWLLGREPGKSGQSLRPRPARPASDLLPDLPVDPQRQQRADRP